MNPKPVNEEDRAELVAYLDGELNEDAARAIEDKINSDPAMRAEAEAMRRTWELLDYLPTHDPSPSFTHRTLERVSAAKPKGSGAAPAPRQWAWRTLARALGRGLRPRPSAGTLALGAGWAAAILLAAGIGFGVTTRVIPREPSDEELARDLGVIEHEKAYEQVGDLDFLKQLDTPDLFGDDPDS
jgi:anti-sigma factor RsiW